MGALAAAGWAYGLGVLDTRYGVKSSARGWLAVVVPELETVNK